MGYISLTGNPITFTANRVNTINSLVLNGKTTQSGTGDPSPTNIRPISGVGLYDAKATANGSETWSYSPGASAVESGYAYMYSTLLPKTVLNKCPVMLTFNKLRFEQRTVYKATSEFVGQMENSNKFLNVSFAVSTLVKYGAISGDGSTYPAAAKAFFAANPTDVYYQSTSYSTAAQVYVGFSLTDANGYHGYAAGPTAPLYDGDTLDFVNGNVIRKNAEIKSYNGETLPGAWISDRDVYSLGATPTIGAQVVYRLAVQVTEMVTISEQITNSLGAVTISAENTMNVTYFQLEVSNNKYQDIQITDNTLLTQFQQAWSNGDYTTAFNIIDNNPQLDTKSFVADVINTLTANLTYLQNLNDPTFKADRIQTSATPPVDLQVGQVYFKTL